RCAIRLVSGILVEVKGNTFANYSVSAIEDKRRSNAAVDLTYGPNFLDNTPAMADTGITRQIRPSTMRQMMVPASGEINMPLLAPGAIYKGFVAKAEVTATDMLHSCSTAANLHD